MNPFMNQIAGSIPDTVQATPEMIWLVLHSVILGVFLMTVTVFTTMRNGTKAAGKLPGLKDTDPSASDVLFNSSNVLYLCVGMTSVMLLVNNNLARAFAIGAAIALVRFRIKVDSKNFAMCLFYGVIIGMACGVDQTFLAYSLAGVFAILQVLILILAKIVARNETPKVESLPALQINTVTTPTTR
jgi:hypothetical protein